MYMIWHQQTCTTRNVKGSSSSVVEMVTDGKLDPHKGIKGTKNEENRCKKWCDYLLTVMKRETKTTDSAFIREVFLTYIYFNWIKREESTHENKIKHDNRRVNAHSTEFEQKH